MGTTYDPNATVIGMTARRFRTLLDAWETNNDMAGVAARRPLNTTVEEVAAVVDEAAARGLLGVGDHLSSGTGFAPTESGKGLLAASTRKRIPAQAAQAILNEVLDRAVAINARKDLPFIVQDVWLYGSLAKGSETVDDIDVVIETRRPDGMSLRQADAMALKLCRKMGGVSVIEKGGVNHETRIERWVKDRFLFGARRDPRISFRSDDGELVRMGAPCKHVLARSKGAMPDAPLLAMHPKSTGRDENFGEPRVAPDLSVPVDLAPAHCEAAHGLTHAALGRSRLYRIGVAYDGARYPEHLEAFAKKHGPLDGRNRYVLHDWKEGSQGILVEAGIRDGVLHVDTLERSDGEPLDPEALSTFLSAVVLCTATRAERLGIPLAEAFVDGDEVGLGEEDVPSATPRP